MKEKLLALYQEMMEDQSIRPHVKVEFRAYLNRHFKAGIKTSAIGGPRVSPLPQTAPMTNRWTPTSKKKLTGPEVVAANRERYKVQTRPGKPDTLEAPVLKPVSEDQKLAALRNEIDSLGGKYHHKAGIPALEKILEKLKADQPEEAQSE